jgi:hypothetical protein
MEPKDATRMVARVAAVAGAIVAIVGLILVFGTRPETAPTSGPESGADAVGTAMQTIVGGALLVTGALAGLTAVLLWLVSQRRARRLR